MSEKNFYQKIYRMAATNKGGPEGRKKTLATLKAKNSPAAKTYEQVLKNNPHFLISKKDPDYHKVRNEVYNRKGMRSLFR